MTANSITHGIAVIGIAHDRVVTISPPTCMQVVCAFNNKLLLFFIHHSPVVQFVEIFSVNQQFVETASGTIYKKYLWIVNWSMMCGSTVITMIMYTFNTQFTR